MESKSVNVISVSVRRVVGQSNMMETKAPGNQIILMRQKISSSVRASFRTYIMTTLLGQSVPAFLLSHGSVLSIFSLLTTYAQFSFSFLFWRNSQFAKFQLAPYRYIQPVFTLLWNLLSKTTLQHSKFRSLFQHSSSWVYKGGSWRAITECEKKHKIWSTLYVCISVARLKQSKKYYPGLQLLLCKTLPKCCVAG